MMPDADPYDLERFVTAQRDDYDTASAELRAGRKRTHWMWYVFPQLVGLGRSSMAERYALRSLDEAAAYLRHPILGPRLLECVGAVLDHGDRTAREIFGSPDDLKLRSSVTLFAAVAAEGSEFQRLLDKFFDGRPDDATLRILAELRSRTS